MTEYAFDLPDPDTLSLDECADWMANVMYAFGPKDPRGEFARGVARRIRQFAPTDTGIRYAGVHDEWNGNVYEVTVVACVETNSPEEAQALTGQLLAGLPSGQGHSAHPLTGPGSWATKVKTIELIRSNA